MFQNAKDAVASKAARAYLNNLIARYGEVEALKIDSRARTVEVSVRLQGEAAPIAARIGRYEIHTADGKSAVEVSDCTCSRPWLENLLRDFVVGRRFPVPPWAAAAL